jgi:predicted amino acid dehydrogenase
VGFLAHFLEPGDLGHWDPTLAPLGERDCARFLDRTKGMLDPFLVGERLVRSAKGTEVALTVIGIPFTPTQVMDALRSGDSGWALDLVKRGVELLRARGCEVAGFGGYTSIVTDNCRLIIEDELALTSGNALTAAAALDALAKSALQARLPARRLGVVGAAGNIGAVMAEVAADQADEVVLVGRKGTLPRLEPVARAIRASRGIEVRLATEMEALRECTMILSATNAPRPVILPEHVGPGPVVLCDVAAPRDVDPRVADERPQATILKGGIIRLPLAQTLELGGMRLPEGQIYGCLAETLLLGLGGVRSHFSYGKLTAAELRRIRALAHEHGFELG